VPLLPLAKLQWSHLAQYLAELAIDLLGPAGLLARGGPDAVASIDLIDAGGVTIGNGSLSVPSRHYVVRELVELFGFAPDGAATIRVTSATPIQAIGIVANQTTGTATPIVAR
jgi:hypothetical protein